eukprot:CAMPEP_0202687752 /NCGR_PEP_ID=MMETSP1385-20130828/3383_1 /ASSEMBLY_ACC=CAM_ASM_000861 /TAXON_ID=933848 /ORGANISM="Elphidium margaritaceum" /LENGTH=693 /DNA_ID=CAMNT_0049342595 /DNA_START=53 /DNA_END=2134 /DNA_ORIENTATION=+
MWGHAHDEYASKRPQSVRNKKAPPKKRTTSKAKLNTSTKSSSVEEKTDGDAEQGASRFKFRGQKNTSNITRAPAYSWNHAHDAYAASKKGSKNKASTAFASTAASSRRKSNSDLGKKSKLRQQRSQTEFTIDVQTIDDEQHSDNEAHTDNENDAENVNHANANSNGNNAQHPSAANRLSVDDDALTRSKSDGSDPAKKVVKRKSQPNIAKTRFISASNMHDRYEGSQASNRHVRTKSAQGNSRSAKKADQEKSKKRKKSRRVVDDDKEEASPDKDKEKDKKSKKKKKKKHDKDKPKEKKHSSNDDKKKKKKKRKKYDSDDESDEKEDKHSKNKKSKLSAQEQEFRSRLEADIISDKPDVCFKDVQGLANVKLALYETVVLPALRPELFTGLRSPTGGLLLFGPPGNGKTMIAKCVAAECASTFFSISASSITSKWVGDAERIMRTLFDLAREKAPSIIFIDEIDSLLTARGGKNEAESSRRIKTEFMVQFGGSKDDPDKRILVIGATNLPNQLDDAVLRRFEKRIMVPLPDAETRSGLLRFLMSKQKTDISSEDYDEIIARTDGYSCSDISTLCKDAAMGPIRSLGVRILEIKCQSDMPPIKLMHFDEALGNVRPSLTSESLAFFEEWNEKHGSKIHLSMSALPENMKPYTQEELDEIVRQREQKEKSVSSSRHESESDSDESDDNSSQESSD